MVKGRTLLKENWLKSVMMFILSGVLGDIIVGECLSICRSASGGMGMGVWYRNVT